MKPGQHFTRFLYLLFTCILVTPLASHAADDHGDTYDTATAVTVNAPATAGEIEITSDQDWFSFNATAGLSYSLKVTPGTIYATHVNLYDSDGTTHITNTIDNVIWTATTNATYYVKIFGFNSTETGTYSFEVISYTDDHGNDNATSTPLTISTPVNGEIEIDNDQDVFNFTPLENTNYSFTATPGTISGVDVRLYGTTYIASGSCGAIWNTPAGTSGTYYVMIRANTSYSRTGTYSLQYNTFTDDHGNDFTSATPVVVDATETNGELEVIGEQDWFSFNAIEGTDYLISATNGSLNYTMLRLHDTDGSSYITSGNNAIVWTCPQGQSGTYYVKVNYNSCDSNSALGTYQFSVSETAVDDHGNSHTDATAITVNNAATAGELEVTGDQDWFSFTATANQAYSFDMNPGTLTNKTLQLYADDGSTVLAAANEGLSWTCPDSGSGTYFIKAYSTSALTGTYALSVDSFTDDHGNSIDDATALTINTQQNGTIDTNVDADWFSFTATAGQTYDLNTTLDSLTEIQIFLIGSSGNYLVSEYSTGHINWSATSSGTYFVRVASNGTESGTYSVLVAHDNTNIVDDPVHSSGSMNIIFITTLMLLVSVFRRQHYRVSH